MSRALRKAAVALLERLAGNAPIEDIMGDLEESYAGYLSTGPVWKANLKFYRDVFSLYGSYALRQRKNSRRSHYLSVNTSLAMFGSYFKVALRSLMRYRFFTIMNIVGLAIGMSVSLLFLAIIADVLEYDKFHSNYDNIYRIITKERDQEGVENYASAPHGVINFLQDYPGIQEVVRLDANLYGEVEYNGKNLPMNGFFVDSGFFDVFDFPLESGDQDPAIANSVLITKKEATKLFSDEDPLGKIISIEPHGDFIVSGILKDHPKKSHLHFDLIAPYSGNDSLINDYHFSFYPSYRNHYVYFQADESFSEDEFLKDLNEFSQEKSEAARVITLNFQAMQDMPMGLELSNSPGPQWDILSLTIFAILSLLILLPACFNYASLSISRALQRAREIGVRKVVGGNRQQIFLQFIIESIVVFIVSFILAYIGFTYIRTEFLQILAPASSSGLTLTLSVSMCLIFLGFILVASFLIGVIPALYFARIKPLNALKNSLGQPQKSRIGIKKALMTFQFTLSVGFIVAVFIILEQYQNTMNYELGFQKENILNIDLQDVAPQHLANAVGTLKEIDQTAFASDIIGAIFSRPVVVYNNLKSDSLSTNELFISENYLQVHDLQLTAGNNFRPGQTERETDVLVNESFVSRFGFSDNSSILGQKLLVDDLELTVRGVVKDFNYANLRYAIEPIILRNSAEQFTLATLKFTTTDYFQLVNQLEDVWEELSEDEFKATLLSADLDAAYLWYFNMIRMVGFLSLLAISVSCLGLLGLVVFQVQRREKEVGIRKIHGASTTSIVYLLSRDFLKLMVVGTLIGVPVTYAMFNFLLPKIQYYSEGISAAPLALGTLLLFLLAGATVTSQTISAAQKNPADTLKYE